MAEAALHLVDVSTGEKQPATTSAYMERIAELESDLSSAERELRKSRRLVKRLQTIQDHERESYPQRELVYRLFEWWKTKSGHKKSMLTPDRFDAIKRALDWGYTPKQIAMAIAGCAAHPYRSDDGVVHDDLTVALRKGKMLEEYARKCPKKRGRST